MKTYSLIMKDLSTEQYAIGNNKKGKLLNALSFICSKAEDETVEKVYYTYTDIGHGERIKGLVIQDIEALYQMSLELGTEYHADRCLRAIEILTYEEQEDACMTLKTTHDLNVCEIYSITELINRMMFINN